MADSPCNHCSSSDAVEHYPNGSYCFSCRALNLNKRLDFEPVEKKQKKPRKIKLTSLTDFWLNWLKQDGVNEKTIQQFEIKYDELSRSIAYPCKNAEKIMGYQLRDAAKKIRPVKYVTFDEPFLFEAATNNSRIVVIVEDAISAMRIWQDAQQNAVALLGTNLSAANRWYLISKYDHHIVWLDGDMAGYKAAKRIYNDLLPYNTVNLMFTREDPKKFDADRLKKLLNWIAK